MRKVLLTVVVITLILVPVSAKNSFAVGVNLGTNMGAGVQYQMKDFDLVGNVGYGLLHGVLSVDAAASYTVTNFTINKVRIDVTGGVGGYLGVPFTTDGDLAVSVIVPVGLKYSMPNKDVPLDFYLRVSPGLQVLPELDFVWGANLAVLWRFN
ncbi:MAG: hypothetical protein QM434_08185 [Spirochaetota bacterium]|jgi:hypothetical protein|nr:hypothetical protein [Spirochaetota bacterium]HOQ93880.1 hypothetical protein [Sphaerochaeta sp.]